MREGLDPRGVAEPELAALVSAGARRQSYRTGWHQVVPSAHDLDCASARPDTLWGSGEHEGADIDGQRRRIGTGLLKAGSAVAFGLLGWAAAHELSSSLFDHAHIAGSAPGAWRLDHHAGTAALLFSCLAIGSLFALLAAPSAQARTSSTAARLPLVLSIGAFVGTDFAERAIAGQHGLPPFLVLMIGASVYALIGTASSLLWRCFVGFALRALAPADEPPRLRAVRRQEVGSRLAGFPSPHWMPASAGRAPPIAVL